MAKHRRIHVSFWDDPYIENLPKDKKFFYLFLMTNPLTTECGIYEMTKKKMEFYTGLSFSEIEELIQSLSDDGKIVYDNQTNEVCLVNKGKYFENEGRPVLDCIQQELNEVKNTNLIRIVLERIVKEKIADVYRSHINPVTAPVHVASDASSDDTSRQEEEKEEEKEEEEKGRCVLDEKETELFFDACKFFGIRQTDMNVKYRKLYRFMENLKKWGRFALFKDNYIAYKRYKEGKREQIHGIDKFIGDVERKYQDGAWYTDDWKQKAEAFSEHDVTEYQTIRSY